MQKGQIPGGRAFKALPGIRIVASAVGLPAPIQLPDGRKPETIGNEDIFRMAMGEDYLAKLAAMGMRPEYPEEVVGLSQRRWTHLIGAPANHAEENSVDLGIKAAEALLAEQGLTADDIDLLLLASTTPHKTTTSSACAIGAALGIQAPCLDLKAGCSTGLYALLSAALHVHLGFERVLLIASETPSKYANPKIQETVIGVGDAAVALLLSPGAAEQGLLGGFLGADGQLGTLVNTPGLLPPTHAAIDAGAYYYHGNAAELKEAVPLRYLDAMQGALAQAGLSPAELDWYVPHQVNRSLTAGVAAKLGLPPEKQVHSLPQYASTAGASVLLALHTALADGRIQPGQTIALNTVGGGLTWGALIWRI